MIVQGLPYSDLSSDRDQPPVFTDHHLFTENITSSYEYPEHTAALGILTTLIGNGNYFINREKIRLNAESYSVISCGSQLAVQVSKAAAQPAVLFFHSKLANVVAQSVLLSNEQLLDGIETTQQLDLSYLEHAQLKTPALKEQLQLLPRLGDSCSSFHSLKADMIVRCILEQLMLQSKAASKFAARLSVVKKSTRVELYRRLSASKEWIAANYHQSITLDQMASVAMLNSQHFLRMFSQCYHVTPHKFLVNLRLEESRRMLAGTSDPINVICNNVGFESVSSFSWLFRQRFGMSPSAFRTRK